MERVSAWQPVKETRRSAVASRERADMEVLLIAFNE